MQPRLIIEYTCAFPAMTCCLYSSAIIIIQQMQVLFSFVPFSPSFQRQWCFEFKENWTHVSLLFTIASKSWAAPTSVSICCSSAQDCYVSNNMLQQEKQPPLNIRYVCHLGSCKIMASATIQRDDIIYLLQIDTLV